MKIAYFDCFSGISGDMCLGALVDAGVPLRQIEKGLKGLGLGGYRLTEEKVLRAGFAATNVHVELTAKGGDAEARRWKDIRAIINASSLPEAIRKQGLQVFRTIFEAEAKVHGSSPEKTHLHELGCIDCLVDIFGTLIGLSCLGAETVYASPVNTGSGLVQTAHGILPVPAPATAELLKGIPCYSSGPAFEMTTPTGAALLKTLASGFGAMPVCTTEIIGNGAGRKDPAGHPNLLRIMLGETATSPAGRETVAVIETNIDDMNPQVYEYVMERLFAAGALDVFLTQVIMKKSRPGVLLTVLCRPEDQPVISSIILSETTSIGLRFHEAGRVVMKRSFREVKTGSGSVRTKHSVLDSREKVMPEYDDCRKIARQTGLPLLEVMERARRKGRGKGQA